MVEAFMTGVRVFTFIDTVVIVYLAAKGRETPVDDINAFAIRLRRFMMRVRNVSVTRDGSRACRRGLNVAQLAPRHAPA